jgi:dipeptidyl aminopeptidase/acylaminoacyl peptidase
MSNISRLFGAACVLALCASPIAAMDSIAAPALEAFGNLPAISNAKISPDGKHLAIIHPVNGRPIVTVFELDSPNAAPKNLGFSDAIARDIIWPNNKQLIGIFQANNKLTYHKDIAVFSRAISIPMDGEPPIVLMGDAPVENRWTSGILDVDSADPNYVLMETAETDAELHNTTERLYDQYFLDLFRVSVSSGRTELVRHGATDTTQFLTDGMGHFLGRIDQTQELKDHLYIGEQEVASYDVRGGTEWTVESLTEDGSALAVRAFGKEDVEALYSLKLGDTTLGPPLFLNPSYDIDEVLLDEHESRVVGVSYIDDMAEYKYFDPKREQVEERLKRALPMQSVKIVSRDAAGANYVVAAEGPKNPETFYLFSPATSQLSVVAKSYPDLSPSDLGEEKAYPYKSRDGLDIHAYLTLPPGKTPKNLPTVIFPHGGPAARDSLEFFWWTQFMASRGYAVLQPNFRGSTGYGGTFRDAGNGEWAGKVQNDITDGVQKLIADGIADPKRICIVGASYGGYAALAGATFNPNQYACAISYAGIADLQLFIDRGVNIGGEETESSSLWEARVGAGKSETGKLDAMSPYAHADQVRIPILLIHSNKDVTVPIEQSEIENKALLSAGKNVQFITLDGDDHYLSLGATRVQLLKEVEKFLAAHIGT